MKKFITMLLGLLLIYNVAITEDFLDEYVSDEEQYVYIEDDDYGEITYDPQIIIYADKDTYHQGDIVILYAHLIDFFIFPQYTIYWQYSEDLENWITIEGEHGLSYSYIISPANYKYYWRVLVKVGE